MGTIRLAAVCAASILVRSSRRRNAALVLKHIAIATLTMLALGKASAGTITSTYSYSIDPVKTGTATIHDLEFIMAGTFVEGGDWSLTTSFFNNQPGGTIGSNADILSVTQDFGPSLTPILSESLLFGIIQGLPQDLLDNNADQKHLVLFLDPLSAQNIQNIAFGTTFPTTNEDQLISAIEQVHRNDLSDSDKVFYYENFIYPFYDAARHARAGMSGTERSIWFAPGDFAIMFYSDGDIVGSGVNTAVSTAAVPEPSTALLGLLGVAGIAFRRIRNQRSA